MERKGGVGLLAKMWGITLLVMALVAILGIFLVAFLVQHSSEEEKVMAIGVICIYAVTSLVGGVLFGKMKAEKRFLWGLAAGASLSVLLWVFSFGFLGMMQMNLMHLFTATAICLGGGMLGGMIS